MGGLGGKRGGVGSGITLSENYVIYIKYVIVIVGISEALRDAEGVFRSVIRHHCLDAKEREMGSSPPSIPFFATSRARPHGWFQSPSTLSPFELRTTWGEEVVVLQAEAVPFQVHGPWIF